MWGLDLVVTLRTKRNIHECSSCPIGTLCADPLAGVLLIVQSRSQYSAVDYVDHCQIYEDLDTLAHIGSVKLRAHLVLAIWYILRMRHIVRAQSRGLRDSAMQTMPSYQNSKDTWFQVRKAEDGFATCPSLFF